MQTLLQDLRYGSRILIKNPGYTALAVLALALGIGTNTAIFSVLNAVLLRHLPYSEPERIVRVDEMGERGGIGCTASRLATRSPWPGRLSCLYWSHPRPAISRLAELRKSILLRC